MSVDDFAILAIVDPIWIVTMPSGMEIFQNQGHGSQVVHSERGPQSCLLSCEPLALLLPGEPPVGMTPMLVILTS